MFSHYLYYKDRYGEERKEEQGQLVSICQGNITLPIGTMASLNFPERR